MSRKGGYKILNLKTNPSYDEIAKILDTEKVILVSGLVVDDVEQKDCFASVEENEGVYTLKTPDYSIQIDENGYSISSGLKGKVTFILDDTEISGFDSFAKIEGDYLHIYAYTYNNREFVDDITITIKFNEPVFKNVPQDVQNYPVVNLGNNSISAIYIETVSEDKKTIDMSLEGFTTSLYMDLRIRIK